MFQAYRILCLLALDRPGKDAALESMCGRAAGRVRPAARRTCWGTVQYVARAATCRETTACDAQEVEPDGELTLHMKRRAQMSAPPFLQGNVLLPALVKARVRVQADIAWQ